MYHDMNNESKEVAPLIPVRMVNEFVYCPRLAYMMWVQGEFAHSADTVEGAIRHKRVDKEGGKLPVEPADQPEEIHARSVALSSEALGITTKIDLVEGSGIDVQPVDYKKGKRPHVPAGAYAPERVQVCAQGLLLREHGFQTDHGFLYFAGSRERVKVAFDDALVNLIDTTEDHLLIIDIGPAENVIIKVESIGRPYRPNERRAVVV